MIVINPISSVNSISSLKYYRITENNSISKNQNNEIYNNTTYSNLNLNSYFYKNEFGDNLAISEEALDSSINKDREDIITDEEIEEELSTDDKQEIREMQSRDLEVRNHEQAHISASGRIATSAPIYKYEKGPDGKMYVTEGSVRFSMPPSNSPEEKLQLAQQLRRMALAPANPSSKDRQVAAKASQKISNAQKEVREEARKELENKNSTKNNPFNSFEVSRARNSYQTTLNYSNYYFNQ